MTGVQVVLCGYVDRESSVYMCVGGEKRGGVQIQYSKARLEHLHLQQEAP